MLSCKDASQIISQSLDRKLTLRERFQLQIHLVLCKFCKRFSQQLEIMCVNVRAVVNSVESDNTIKMPSSAKERIADAFKSHQ